MPNKNRKSIRLKEYDYSEPGDYFITICTEDGKCLFGEVVDGEMVLNEIGKITEKCCLEIPKHFPNVELDIFQIMPNHLHFILSILEEENNSNGCRGVIHDAHKKNILNNKEGVIYDAPTGTELAIKFDKKYFSKISSDQGLLSRSIQGFKAAVTRICNKQDLKIEWQRGFYDHIIRNEKSYDEIYTYILSNPQTWDRDRNNPKNFLLDKFTKIS
ncbi:MAG: hypothetical protein PHU42_03205 [Patescibacteria group bacterium]|nr:hypothetical protein [Patescibacteria group bacterium]